jgi:two-component system, sensor histidine kinase RegB
MPSAPVTTDAAAAHHAEAGAAPGTHPPPDRAGDGCRLSPSQGLRLLADLRCLMPVATLPLLLHTAHPGGTGDAIEPLPLLGAQVLIALATCLRLRRAWPVHAPELAAQAHLDIALLVASLLCAGAAAPSFLLLLPVPLLIAASALERAWLGLAATSTVAACGFIGAFGVSHVDAAAGAAGLRNASGAVVFAWTLTAAVLAVVAARINLACRRSGSATLAPRETPTCPESAAVLDTLATEYAHRLSSPLATMAIVVGESMRKHANDPLLLPDLQLLESQIEECKKILSDLAAAGGRPRVERAEALAVDRFLRGIVDQARALHPGTAVTASLDTRAPAPRVIADQGLRQRIEGLVDDAIGRSPQGIVLAADWSGDNLVISMLEPGSRAVAADETLMARLLRRFQSSSKDDKPNALSEIRVPLGAITIGANSKKNDGTNARR